MKEKLFKVVFVVLGIIYIPFFLIGILLHTVSRFFLALSYFLLMEHKMALDIIKSLTKWRPVKAA